MDMEMRMNDLYPKTLFDAAMEALGIFGGIIEGLHGRLGVGPMEDELAAEAAEFG